MTVRLFLVCVAAFFAGCGGPARNLEIIEARLVGGGQAGVMTGGEGFEVPSSDRLYTMEGKLKNNGDQPVSNVVIVFRITVSSERRVLSAEIPSIAPGQTVAFQSDRLATPSPVKYTGEYSVRIEKK